MRNLALMFLAAAASASGEQAFKNGEDTGRNPSLVEPHKALIPTIDVARATGWKEGERPTAAVGLTVTAFARGLSHPRTIYVLPNGDVLVTETNAPERPQDSKGIKGVVMQASKKKAGAAVASANRIRLLRDADGDGVAEKQEVLLDKLNSPFGMALIEDTLYVANTDALVKVPYERGTTHITQAQQKIADLPGGPINHHWTKSLLASRDGKHLYVGVGSNSNVAENGLDAEAGRAAILLVDVATGHTRLFASGLRNPTAMAWQPHGDALWAVVNERDELGDNLVPDFLTSVKDGAFYGWPFSYFGQHVDDRVKPQDPARVAAAVVPDYALGSHVAALGLAFNTSEKWPQPMQNGAFVGLHGSWNRKPPSGYKVIFVPFANDTADGAMRDVLTGFLDDKGNARGRPVGVAMDARGGLLVADDVGDVVWRVTPAL